MNWSLRDTIILLAGAALTAIGMVASGFLRQAGKELYLKCKNKWFPPPPDPVLVDFAFKATGYAPEALIWARQDSLYRKEADGCTYYLDPASRKIMRNNGQQMEFLMVRPGAKKIQ